MRRQYFAIKPPFIDSLVDWQKEKGNCLGKKETNSKWRSKLRAKPEHFLAEFEFKYCQCAVKVELYHLVCLAAAGLEMSFFKATAGICVCLLLLYKK